MIKHPIFLLSFFLYVCIIILRASGIDLPFVHDHLADFLCMPVLLPIAHFILKLFAPQAPKYLSVVEIMMAVGLYAFLFEGLFPLISEKTTGDPWDILAYSLGGAVFWYFINRDFVSSPNGGQ